jgi:hypothetical protein
MIKVLLDPSRRDDLISMLYIMIHFAEGTLPWLYKNSLSVDERFMMVWKLKVGLMPHEICAKRSSNKCAYQITYKYRASYSRPRVFIWPII